MALKLLEDWSYSISRLVTSTVCKTKILRSVLGSEVGKQKQRDTVASFEAENELPARMMDADIDSSIHEPDVLELAVPKVGVPTIVSKIPSPCREAVAWGKAVTQRRVEGGTEGEMDAEGDTEEDGLRLGEADGDNEGLRDGEMDGLELGDEELEGDREKEPGDVVDSVNPNNVRS